MRKIIEQLKDDPECISELAVEVIYGLFVYLYLRQLHGFNKELKLIFNTANMNYDEASRLLAYKENTPWHYFFGGIVLFIIGIGVLATIKYLAKRAYNKGIAYLILFISAGIQLRCYYLIWYELNNPIIAAIAVFLGIGCLVVSFD